MHIFSGINIKEVAAGIFWITKMRETLFIRVFYDRINRNIAVVQPNEPAYDRIMIDPGRYKFIGTYNHECEPEHIVQDINKLTTELNQGRIPSSLGKHIHVMRLEDDT